MADNSDSLLREVEEELRRERMQKIWDRYSGLIVGGALLIVLGVGGFKYLEHRRIASAEAAGADFAAAQRLSSENKDAEAKAAFEKIAQSGPYGYAALSKLHLAGFAAKEGKTQEAIASYESLINQAGVDSLLKNFAQLQIASLQAGAADFTEVKNRLTPLAADDSAFKTTAQELLGVAALKAGKIDEARSYLEPLLLDAGASRGLQERVKIMMAEIARKETLAAPAKAEPPPATDTKSSEPTAAPAKGSENK